MALWAWPIVTIFPIVSAPARIRMLAVMVLNHARQASLWICFIGGTLTNVGSGQLLLGKLPVPVGQLTHPFFRLLRNEGGTPNRGRGSCQRNSAKIARNRPFIHQIARHPRGTTIRLNSEPPRKPIAQIVSGALRNQEHCGDIR